MRRPLPLQHLLAMPRRLLLFAVLCAGCSDVPDDTARVPADEAVAPGLPAFAASMAEEPCAVLTPALVSEAVGVPADQLTQREVAGTCSYDWDGGTAALLRLEAFASPTEAGDHFAQRYRETSAAEHAEADAAMREGLARRQEAGEMTAEEAEVAERLSGVVGEAAAQTRYEPVSGVGDEAVYDGTVRTADNPLLGATTTAESKLHFRLGNLVTGVTVDLFKVSGDPEALRAGPPPEVRRRNREATTALARAVAEALR